MTGSIKARSRVAFGSEHGVYTYPHTRSLVILSIYFGMCTRR